MSPEVMDPESFGLDKRASRTKSSDCYALGMTVYEVLSGHVPFPQYNDIIVTLRVSRGERPERPQGTGGKWFTDGVWEILEQCWKPEPGDRPSANPVCRRFEEASKSWTPPTPTEEDPQVADVSAPPLSHLHAQESVYSETPPY